MELKSLVAEIRTKLDISQQELAQEIGTSLLSVYRWEHGTGTPSPAQMNILEKIHQDLQAGNGFSPEHVKKTFLSRGVKRQPYANTLLGYLVPEVDLSVEPHQPILQRITSQQILSENGFEDLNYVLNKHKNAAATECIPPQSGISAGKNTYTYDAHTYHTKVPPQGIAELISYYLPEGGLVFDPFAGSGMTGVASNFIGCDAVLNELSPAACFIADRFTSTIPGELFEAGVQTILDELDYLRNELYTTICRECNQPVEIIYTIWSYNIICYHCDQEFQAWEHCRKYGVSVKEHKILNDFPCPHCNKTVKKSKALRTTSEPVMVVYKCCQGEYKHHSLNDFDRIVLSKIEENFFVDWDFAPKVNLPDGINLRQPKKHGLDRIDKFYTSRNLVAMSQLWKTIHRVDDEQLAAFLAFAFTSLYQRVTRLAEFRFWGGSGNVAHFNVPFISKEANVFDTFQRKARTIQDHLQTTATRYHGQSIVVNNSATNLSFLSDNSVDMIFTDPPFGANINYSEMNILWEAWLGQFTDSTHEVIINRIQGKELGEYEELMAKSLAEAYRVLRPGHWMLLVFMNSSKKVFESLKKTIVDAGFSIVQINIFDKQHATFKQLVSENTPGSDLMFHCQKPKLPAKGNNKHKFSGEDAYQFLNKFLQGVDIETFRVDYLHVNRESEFDYRKLYSFWLVQSFSNGQPILDFPDFRDAVRKWLIETENGEHL